MEVTEPGNYFAAPVEIKQVTAITHRKHFLQKDKISCKKINEIFRTDWRRYGIYFTDEQSDKVL